MTSPDPAYHWSPLLGKARVSQVFTVLFQIGVSRGIRLEVKENLNQRQDTMPKYVIERESPGAGKSSVEDLRAAAQKSCGVLQKLGTDIQWVQSYITDDKVYCVYIARDEELVREHAKQGGFPANRISEIRTIIDPTTAEA
jgi:predicted Rdx family selenoprotein